MGISVEHILTRNLSEHLSTPVLLLDEAGRLIFFNEAAERIVGRPHDDLAEVGTDWHKLLHVVGDRGVLAGLSERAPTSGSLRLEVAGGEAEDFVAWALPLVGRDGGHLGSIISFWAA